MDEFNQKFVDRVKEIAKQEATAVYNELGTRYNVAKVPTHVHDGVDSVQIGQKDILQEEKYIALLQVFNPDPINPDTSTETIGGVYNPVRISFLGFAANNADASPATKRVILSGEINFGKCFNVVDPNPPVVISTTGPGKPFIQGGNAMYVDSTDLTKNRVASSVTDFINAVDDTATTVARGRALSYNNQTGLLSLEFTLAGNWKIQGAFTVT